MHNDLLSTLDQFGLVGRRVLRILFVCYRWMDDKQDKFCDIYEQDAGEMEDNFSDRIKERGMGNYPIGQIYTPINVQ